MLLGLFPSLAAFYVCQSQHRHWARELSTLPAEAWKQAERDAAGAVAAMPDTPNMATLYAQLVSRGVKFDPLTRTTSFPEGKGPTPQELALIKANRAAFARIVARIVAAQQEAQDQSEAWAYRSKELPVLVEAFFALPWFWYFTLARIAELSMAIRGGT